MGTQQLQAANMVDALVEPVVKVKCLKLKSVLGLYFLIFEFFWGVVFTRRKKDAGLLNYLPIKLMNREDC